MNSVCPLGMGDKGLFLKDFYLLWWTEQLKILKQKMTYISQNLEKITIVGAVSLLYELKDNAGIVLGFCSSFHLTL